MRAIFEHFFGFSTILSESNALDTIGTRWYHILVIYKHKASIKTLRKGEKYDSAQKQIFAYLFYGCKMYSQKSRLEIFSKYDGTFIGSLNTTTLYSLSALCGVLTMCLSVFILRSLIDGTPYVKIVLALAFAAIALLAAICF